jgi:site-specific DNA-methyltransferase (adenine-specific)
MQTPNVNPTLNYLVGDTREQIATIPDGSISLVATSPPFIALRSYLPADHPMKHAEIGSEPDPATFLDTLLQLTAEWGRVLAPWGSIAIELGDTYAASGSGGENNLYTSGYNGGRTCETQKPPGAAGVRAGDWPRPKCLALVPQLYAASLAYGRNLLTGEPSPAGQWLVRNMIVWHRPNPAVGALGDKYRPSTSYITVATRSPKRWFDLTAVRTETSGRKADISDPRLHPNKQRNGTNFNTLGPYIPSAGAPPLDTWFDHHDTWTLTTQPSSLSHYAMWPPKLAERLILSMCPEQVCATCGEPRRRIERSTPSVDGVVGKIVGFSNGLNATHGNYEQVGGTFATHKTTLGFTDCGHDNYQPGHVLDPFAGTFTTGLVAEYHHRNATGIDIDERNRDMVPQRREEVRRALNPTHVKPIDGQLDMFGEATT